VHWKGWVAMKSRSLLESSPSPPTSANLAAIVFLVAGVVIPDIGRTLNFDDAKLVKNEPSDAIIAALIIDFKSNTDLWEARTTAWKYFGSGLDYARWHFRKASFANSTLAMINLTDANLEEAFLPRANLTLARLPGATLDQAKLQEATLHKANLAGAQLSGAILRGADLRGAHLPNILQVQSRPRQLAQNIPSEETTTGGAGTTIGTGTQGSECRYKGVPPPADDVTLDLSDADLRGADLTCADLRKADLRNAIADKDTNFDRTNFTGADLKGANFSYSKLKGAKLGEAIFGVGTNFTCADLRGATLPYNLEGVILNGANLYGVEFTKKPREQGSGASTPLINLKNAELQFTIQTTSDPFTCTDPKSPTKDTGSP
jgi:uncharacterized protein YjbI with pentapeptide repeats